jgi:hypothetical protein
MHKIVVGSLHAHFCEGAQPTLFMGLQTKFSRVQSSLQPLVLSHISPGSRIWLPHRSWVVPLSLGKVVDPVELESAEPPVVLVFVPVVVGSVVAVADDENEPDPSVTSVVVAAVLASATQALSRQTKPDRQRPSEHSQPSDPSMHCEVDVFLKQPRMQAKAAAAREGLSMTQSYR